MEARVFLRDARHLDKFLYTLSSETFYEPFEQHYTPSREFAEIVTSVASGGGEDWLLTQDGFWFHSHRKQSKVPMQGWKVHVSAMLSNAVPILRTVSQCAFANEVPFKFLIDKNILSLTTSKRWARGSSGKFITLYPADTAGCKRLLEALFAELSGEEGPYILSDNRYKDCRVLYYRYGGLARNTRLNILGERVPVIISPTGDTIPDVRNPYFSLPSWVSDPFSCQASDSEPDGLTLRDGRYVITQALSFSNSGGVYLADDRTAGAQVVIKEARPHTLQDGRGNDAISLLTKEQSILELLRDTGIAPKVVEAFYDWENFFLVQEHIEGLDVRHLMLGKSPLTRVNPSLADTRHFYHIFTSIFKSFARVIETLHEKGVVFGDLSASNIKIDPDTYAVTLIDFEGSFRVGLDDPTPLFTPGFRDPLTVRQAAAMKDDLYALAAIMLYAIFPLNSLSALRRDLYEGPLRIVLADLGWDKTSVFEAINGLSRGAISCVQVCHFLDAPASLRTPAVSSNIDSDDCTRIIKELGRFIVVNMRVGADSLFPADPFMYRTNVLSLGFGACGVLYALKKSDIEIPANAFEWLEEHLRTVTADTIPPGLLTGSAGIAWTLSDLGFVDRAADAMDIANSSPLKGQHHSYLHGMAGIGMANLQMYLRTRDPKYLSAAEDLASCLIKSASESEYGVFWESDSVVHVGFGYGQSGVALFFLRLSQLTANDQFLAFGRRALEFDLSHGSEVEHGVLSFPRGPGDFTFDPYIEEGSAGIAKVALRYGSWDRMDMILSEVHRKYSTFPGMLFGLGGLVDVLTDAFLVSKDKKYLEMAQRPLSGIRDLYLIHFPEGVATPGDGLFRVSCDYATGVAGVLRAMHRFAHLGQADFMLDEIAEQCRIQNTPPKGLQQPLAASSLPY